LVESNLAGASLFERENAKIAPNIAKLYAGTKPATMRRYGETDDKTEDVIGSGDAEWAYALWGGPEPLSGCRSRVAPVARFSRRIAHIRVKATEFISPRANT
jgi:hypothetical protein